MLIFLQAAEAAIIVAIIMDVAVELDTPWRVFPIFTVAPVQQSLPPRIFVLHAMKLLTLLSPRHYSLEPVTVPSCHYL